MVNKVYQNINETIKLLKLRLIPILTIACLLIFIPTSIAEQQVESIDQPDIKDVKLWEYYIDIRSNYNYYWTAMNPSKYVIPDNPIIQYFANNTDKVQIRYKPDATDYWQNPDYTLKIMQGDCEDQSLVWVSIHRAKGHKAIVVGGYLYFDDGTSIRDIWYEYVDGEQHQIKFVAPISNVRKFYAIPVFMFNDNMGIHDYDPEWMNLTT